MHADSEGDALRLTFPGHALAPREARAAVTEFAAARLSRPRSADLALVVSEVVTNAIRHGRAGGAIELRAMRRDDRLRVEISDTGLGPVSAPRSTQSSAEGGFGLFLVEQLSTRWGLVREAATTRVWFEVEDV